MSHKHYNSIMEQPERKYRINQLLNSLPHTDNRKALRVLPSVLGISFKTFSNYRSITIDDSQDIPHTVVVKLEQFFGIKPGELQNFTTDVRPISEMQEDTGDLSDKFGLAKS